MHTSWPSFLRRPDGLPFAVLNNYSGANGLVDTHIHSDRAVLHGLLEVLVDALDNIQIGGHCRRQCHDRYQSRRRGP